MNILDMLGGLMNPPQIAPIAPVAPVAPVGPDVPMPPRRPVEFGGTPEPPMELHDDTASKGNVLAVIDPSKLKKDDGFFNRGDFATMAAGAEHGMGRGKMSALAAGFAAGLKSRDAYADRQEDREAKRALAAFDQSYKNRSLANSERGTEQRGQYYDGMLKNATRRQNWQETPDSDNPDDYSGMDGELKALAAQHRAEAGMRQRLGIHVAPHPYASQADREARAAAQAKYDAWSAQPEHIWNRVTAARKAKEEAAAKAAGATTAPAGTTTAPAGTVTTPPPAGTAATTAPATTAAPAPAGNPPVPGARKAPDGKWYVPDPNRPGKYQMVQ